MKRRSAMILCLVFFALGAGAEWYFARHQITQNARNRRAKFDAQVQDLKAKDQAKRWDPLPPPDMPAYGAPIPVPSFTPLPPPGLVQILDGVISPGSDLERALNARFSEIVGSNPDPDMADLVHAIESGKLGVRFGPLPPNLLAVFRLWPYDRNIAAVDKPLDQYGPEIVVSMDFIASAVDADGLRMFEVVVDHEYRHYKQYMETEDENLRRSFIYAMSKPGATTDASVCTFIWQKEFDAYRHSSQNAVRWGVRDDFSSRVSDTRAFSQLVFMTAGLSIASSAPECLPVWAKLAGHPHPEAFEP